MSDDLDELARLRRAAFGPSATAEERAAAEAALRRLGERSRERVPEVPEVPEMQPWPAAMPFGVNDQTSKSESVALVDEAAPKLWKRRIRVGWLAPIAVGALVVGAVGALGAAGQFATTDVTVVQTPQPDSSPAVGNSSGTLITGPGNVAAANSWFDSPATSTDAFPLTVLLRQIGVDQDQVRLLLDDGGRKLWAAKQGTAGFCLGIYDNSADNSFFNCATVQEFADAGVVIVTPEFGAWWGGQGIRTMWRTDG